MSKEIRRRAPRRSRLRWEWYWKEKLSTKGRMQAEYEMIKNKPLSVTAQEFIDSAIEKLDPFEATAILGTTVIVKQGLDWSTVLVQALKGVEGSMIWKSLPWMKFIPKQEGVSTKELLGQNELFEWVLSFSIAYVIVRHFDKVVNLGTGILGIARSLVGIVG